MIPICEPFLSNLERKYLINCVDTNWISSQGKYIREFEEKFAHYVGCEYGVATSNCTTALQLVLAALDVLPGDEIITSNLSFIAPANTIKHRFSKAILVDSDPQTWNIDPKRIEEKITSKTKAIIIVHAFGHPCDMDEINKICDKYNIPLIEDNAESPGSYYKAKPTGSFGLASCFSFFANKIITTGEGGIVTTNDPSFYRELLILRDHGMSREQHYHYTHIGFNFRMTNMQAAIGLAQLERIDQILEKRKENEELYKNFLGQSPLVSFRKDKTDVMPVSWLNTVLLADNLKITREELKGILAQKYKIDTRPMIPPINTQPPYQNENKKNIFKISEQISSKALHLPSSTHLKRSEIEYISYAILRELESE